jgi:hypothetical protein
MDNSLCSPSAPTEQWALAWIPSERGSLLWTYERALGGTCPGYPPLAFLQCIIQNITSCLVMCRDRTVVPEVELTERSSQWSAISRRMTKSWFAGLRCHLSSDGLWYLWRNVISWYQLASSIFPVIKGMFIIFELSL